MLLRFATNDFFVSSKKQIKKSYTCIVSSASVYLRMRRNANFSFFDTCMYKPYFSLNWRSHHNRKVSQTKTFYVHSRYENI